MGLFAYLLCLIIYVYYKYILSDHCNSLNNLSSVLVLLLTSGICMNFCKCWTEWNFLLRFAMQLRASGEVTVFYRCYYYVYITVVVAFKCIYVFCSGCILVCGVGRPDRLFTGFTLCGGFTLLSWSGFPVKLWFARLFAFGIDNLLEFFFGLMLYALCSCGMTVYLGLCDVLSYFGNSYGCVILEVLDFLI
eukprot:gene13064-8910_t